MPIDKEDGPLKWNLNTILAVVGFTVTIIGQVVAFTVLWTNQSRDIKDLNNQVAGINQRFVVETQDRKDRIADFTKGQSDLKTQVAQIVPLSFQVTQALTQSTENKESIRQTNERMNRVVEVIGGKIDSVVESVNSLSKNVAVLAAQNEKAQKTEFRTPILVPK